MDKKGFTLIELLAVIVILAIIALIATPIVLNIIKDTRESAGLRSVEMYLEAVEQAVSIEKMNNTNFNPNSCKITSGNLDCGGTNVQVEVKGEKPLKGNIVFESGKIIKIRLEYKNNKIILKNEKGNLEYFDYNRNSDINFVVEGIKEQKTTTGKNLYSGGDVSGTHSLTVELNERIPSGTYTLSAKIVSSDTNDTVSNVSFRNDEMVEVATFNLSRNTRASYTFVLNNDIGIIRFYAGTNSGSSEGDDFAFTDIQIETGEVATEYEEYTGGKPSPSPEYPQEIPLTGTLNQKTGKYDINVTASTKNGVKSKSLTLTSPVKLTKWDKLVKKDGVWGWSIWNSEFIFSEDKNFYVGGLWNDELSFSIYNAPKINNRNEGYSEMFIFLANPQTRTPQVEAIDWYDNSLLVWLNKDRGVLDAESFNAYFSEKNIKIQYNTAEEQAFHPLPDEEQNLLYNLKL